MRWSIGRKIASAFGLAVALLLVVGAVSRDSTAKLIDSSDWVQHTHQVLTRALHQVKDRSMAANAS
jgi:CHASE3 domain sensor protein